MLDTFETLKTLTETPGLSGAEAPIAQLVSDLWRPYVDELDVDHMGNVLARKQGAGEAPRPTLLIAAHMDEIGLLVTQVVANEHGAGFLRVTNVGGVDIRHLYGQVVTVHGREPLRGILGSLPATMLPEERRTQPYGYLDLVVDTGLPAETLREQVTIGDFVSFHQPLRKLQGNLVTGKALDNRASVAAVAICLEHLMTRAHQWDVLAVATVQEETRLLGAFTSAFTQRPDVAIAIDVTFGSGPGTKDPTAFDLNQGPVVGYGPNVHPGVFAALKDAADAIEMSTRTDVHARYSGTDAYALQIVRAGIPTGLVSIPLRYMHTMVETVTLKDVSRTGRLVAEFAAQLPLDFVETLTAGLMDTGTK